jgi:legumain
MYDDQANNDENPFPGAMYNQASGKKAGFNVYKGLQKDFTGEQVTALNIVSALKCNSTANTPCLKSTAEDNIFIYWAGHGADGELEMPAKPPLQAEELISTLEYLHAQKRYKQLLIYIEACDSGSIFAAAAQRLTAINALAITAAQPDENSYPIYCCDYFRPPSCTVGGQDVGACLGDMFSVAWLQDSDSHNASETISHQLIVATQKTAPVGGNPGSHVMHYGDAAILQEPITSFQGPGKSSEVLSAGLADDLMASRVTETTPWLVAMRSHGR